MFLISMGIMAYNEEANMARLLRAVLNQRLVHGQLKEIFVVSSGSRDRTEEIVKTFMQEDKRVHLLVQQQREGKASAINLFLSHATGDILVLESGDTLPEEGTLDRLIAPFKDSRVGMSGAHPIPVNPKEHFMGFVVNLMWALHHRIALDKPKLGELVAFRPFVKKIPVDTAVDEASIEAIVREAGYHLVYVPEAVVLNKGPDNITDFIKQRRRIAAGHRSLQCREKYKVSSTNPRRIISILAKGHTWSLKETMWTVGAIGLETIGRVLGYYDFYIKRTNPFIWDIASSTKKWD